ncbi:MAG: F0F1 ATP synthase subunit epsilon [Chloroflexi bacterium]|jgi:F-type H+-transporting ATPase subunit epsilon|nr:F0F1 ATP synthase subunit epsilon [Chloroflexota bacterium]
MSDEWGIPSQLRLRIITPEEALFEGEVDWAQVPLLDGLVGIWPGHAPLAAAISPGPVSYLAQGEIREVSVRSGILRVTPDECVVLVGAWEKEETLAPSSADKAELFDKLEDELARALGTDQTDKEQPGE